MGGVGGKGPGTGQLEGGTLSPLIEPPIIDPLGLRKIPAVGHLGGQMVGSFLEKCLDFF